MDADHRDYIVGVLVDESTGAYFREYIKQMATEDVRRLQMLSLYGMKQLLLGELDESAD